MPKLKGVLKSLEGLEKSIADCYVKTQAGIYELDVDLEGTNYKTALNRIKEERNNLKTDIESLSKFRSLSDVEGFDPGQVDEYLKAMEMVKEGNGDEKLEKLNKQHQKQTAKLQTQIADLQKTITDKDGEVSQAKQDKDNFIIKTELMREAASSGVLKDCIEDVYVLNKHRFALNDKAVEIIDDDGDFTGKTPREFFTTDYKEMKPNFYEATNMKGGGSKSSNQQSKGGPNMTSVDKISQGLQNMKTG